MMTDKLLVKKGHTALLTINNPAANTLACGLRWVVPWVPDISLREIPG
ncbi:MAG: hypothetical protein WD356_07215 [Pseudomonadales bacterium]